MSELIYEVDWFEEYGSISWTDDDDIGIVHNHFHCPKCGEKDARTDMYIEYSENHYLDRSGKNLFSCGECSADFEFLEMIDYKHDKAKIKFLESEM
jgi:hypothetical protein